MIIIRTNNKTVKDGCQYKKYQYFYKEKYRNECEIQLTMIIIIVNIISSEIESQ